jgi:alpha-tubulin suppressor-like RCC1 family protein
VTVALDGIEQIAGGGEHACALRDGQIWCWGWNEEGQLGDGTENSHGIPVAVGGITGATQVAAGDRHTCALDAGTVKCWGWNVSGQLGNGSLASSDVPVDVLMGASSVGAGSHHSCAVTGGMVQCWGDNDVGQLGNGSTTDSTTPVTVTGITNAAQVVVRDRRTYALLADGSIRAWGYGCDSRLGATGQRCATNPLPLPVPLAGAARTLVSGYDSTCAIKMDNTLWCWGPNWAGQLGTGTYITESQPAQVAALPNVLDVASGGSHVCAVRGDGTVVCWGSDGVNQLGDGITREAKPTAARLVCED